MIFFCCFGFLDFGLGCEFLDLMFYIHAFLDLFLVRFGIVMLVLGCLGVCFISALVTW